MIIFINKYYCDDRVALTRSSETKKIEIIHFKIETYQTYTSTISKRRWKRIVKWLSKRRCDDITMIEKIRRESNLFAHQFKVKERWDLITSRIVRILIVHKRSHYHCSTFSRMFKKDKENDQEILFIEQKFVEIASSKHRQNTLILRTKIQKEKTIVMLISINNKYVINVKLL